MRFRLPFHVGLVTGLIAISFALGGCLHYEATTATPIKGILLDRDGTPIAGAQVWAYVEPNGFFYKPENIAFGPALTQADGRFEVPMRAVNMLETDTVFDGSTTPSLLILHRERGSFGAHSIKEGKDLGYMKLTWPETYGPPRKPQAIDIEGLPKAARKIAEAYLAQK